MVPDLNDFSNSFKSEDELRRALVRLFLTIKGIRNVRLLHGPNELGKDIIFETTDAVGDEHVVACVVKNEKISGKAETGARLVVTQAQQALDTAFTDEKGRPCFVDEVFIISPFEVSQAAMDSVKGAMGPARGQVTFKCGVKLLRLFQKHLPEYLLLEGNLLGSYVARIISEVNQDSAVTNVLLQHGLVQSVQKTLKQTYVAPSLEVIIRRFDFRVSVPKPSVLAGPLYWAELEKSNTQLENIAHLGLLHGWTGSQMTDADYAKIQCLREELKQEWEREYQNLRSKDKQAERPVTLRDTAQLKIHNWPDLDKKYGDVLKKALEIERLIRQEVHEANAFSSQPKLADESLKAGSYLKYKRAEMLSRAAPRLLAAIGQATRIGISDAFVSTGEMPILLTAPAGFGKSSFCRANALQNAEVLVSGSGKVVPVLVPLHTLSARRATTFLETFISDKEIRRILEEGHDFKVHLYLDGLDEVPSTEKQRELMLLAEQGWERYKDRLALVVTGREHVDGPWLLWLTRIRLREFDDRQIRTLAGNWLDTVEGVESFFKELCRSERLQPIMRTPLLCALTLSIFRGLHRLPENRVRLYEIFVSLLCGGWDAAKGVNRGSKFGPQPKLQMSQVLAAIVHQSNRLEINANDLKLAVRQIMPELERNRIAILSELLQDGLLVPVGAHHMFAHLSFQEFLTAKDMVQPTGRRAARALLSYLSGDDWWKAVVSFYIEMTSRPEEAISWIDGAAESAAERVGRGVVEPRQEYLASIIRNLKQML